MAWASEMTNVSGYTRTASAPFLSAPNGRTSSDHASQLVEAKEMRCTTTTKLAVLHPECTAGGSTAPAASESRRATLLLADAPCILHNLCQSA